MSKKSIFPLLTSPSLVSMQKSCSFIIETKSRPKNFLWKLGEINHIAGLFVGPSMVLGCELDLVEAAWGSAIEVAADSQKTYKVGAFTELSLKILDSVNK